MTISASIKFVQGANVGVAGVALVAIDGDGTTVVSSNGDDVTGPVVRWKWTMLGVPTGSAVPVGLMSDGPFATASFDYDLPGGYHLELAAFDSAGAQKVDRRTFLVLEASGRKIPPFDAEAPALNFSSNLFGWQPIMEDWLKLLDGKASFVNNGTGTLNNVTTKSGGKSVYGLSFTNAGGASVTGFAGGYAGQRLFVSATGGATVVLKNQDAGSSAGNRIVTGGSDFTLPAGASAELLYDAVATRWRVVQGPGSGSTIPITDASIHGAPRTLTAVEHGDDVVGLQDILCVGGDFSLTSTKTFDGVQFSAKTSLTFFTLDGAGFEVGGGGLTALANNSFVIEGALSPPSIASLLGGGVAVFFCANAQTVPTLNVAGGAIIYVENGVLKYRNPAGGIVKLQGGPAIPISVLDIDWSIAGVYTKTLAAGANTFTFSNDADGDTIIVVVTGAASTLTWPTVAWAGGAPPTQTATGTDVYTFVKAGTTIYGSVVQNLS